jgi:hypothetical protein
MEALEDPVQDEPIDAYEPQPEEILEEQYYRLGARPKKLCSRRWMKN